MKIMNIYKSIQNFFHKISKGFLTVLNWFKKSIKSMRLYSINSKEAPEFEHLNSAFKDLSSQLTLENIDFERTTKVIDELSAASFTSIRRIKRYSKALRKFRIIFIIETVVIIALILSIISLSVGTKKLNTEIHDLNYNAFVSESVYEAEIETLWKVLRTQNTPYNESN